MKALELIEKLNIKPINECFENRQIKQIAVHRAGLELAGLVSNDYQSHIIGWGTKEMKFMASISEQSVDDAIERIVTKTTPLFVLSSGFDNEKIKDKILKLANDRKVPVISVDDHLSNISSMISYTVQADSGKVSTEHASLVIVHGVGVMIKGPSGIGKSESVLELIQRGSIFVSDDTVNITKVGSMFLGRPANLTKGLLEARGIGLVNIPFVYGANSMKSETEIELVIEIVPEDKLNEVDRLGTKGLTHKVLGGGIPLIQIPSAAGRSLASLIIAATDVFLAKKNGMDPLEEINKRRDNE